MPLFEDPDEEIAEIERKKVRRTMRDRPVDRATVERTERWASDAPWGSPEAIALLAKRGIDPDSKMGRTIMNTMVKTTSKRGLGLHSVGDVVRGGADAVSNVADFVTPEGVEDAIGNARNFAKPAVRGAATVAQSIGEIPGAITRDVTAAYREDGFWGDMDSFKRALGMATGGSIEQTTLGAALEDSEAQGGGTVFDALTGRGPGPKLDLGEGFLPGGRARERQAQNARDLASIQGPNGPMAVTLGRVLANHVVEPGTKPFTVLSGTVDLAASLSVMDPLNAAGKSVKAANAANRLFDAGAISGVRRGTLPEVVDGWLASKDGRRVVQYLTESTPEQFDEVWKRTGQKLPVKTVDALTKAETEAEVLSILRPQLGFEILEKPTLARLPEVRRRMDGVRLLQTMPGQHIDANDIDDAVRQLDRFQKNVKLDPELIAQNNRLMAQAESPTEVYDVLINKVIRDSVDPKLGKATKVWSNYRANFAKYFVDEIGDNVGIMETTIDGIPTSLPTPHLYVEYLNRVIPLPDARDLRRATSRFGRFIDDNQVLDVGVAAGDAFMQDLWKPMTLLRGAWTVRVVGEEQVRMAAAGLNSVFSHPLSHIADLVQKRGDSGIAGDVLRGSDRGAAAMSRGSAGFRGNRNIINTRYKDVYGRDQPEYALSWAEELAQLHADPIARRLVAGLGDGDTMTATRTGNPITDVKEWFSGGAGQKFRDEMATSSGREDLLTREGADAYVDSVLERVKIKTGEQSELMDLVATGKLDDVSLVEADQITREIQDRLAAMAADGIGPAKVKGDVNIRVRQSSASKVGEFADSVTETLFNTLMSRPTNYLSRSPAFRQFYWQRVEGLMASMDDASKVKALRNAEAAKLPGKQLDALRKAAADVGSDARTLTLDDADLLAKGYGLDKTRELLYDLDERGQFFDITRLIFPFGEAWKELLTRWAKLGTENPIVPRRAQQTVEGARGAGVFRTNEQGDEVFEYPLSGWVNEKLFGAPIPFTGRVAGLSLMTEVLPGVGPVVQIPAGQFLPETPEWDGIRHLLLPFGEKDGEAGFLESQLPAWLQKMRTSGLLRNVPGVNLVMGTDDTQERLLANTAMDLLAWEVSSGKRPRPESLAEIQEATEENMDKARWLFFVRGAVQFGAPTAPSPEAVAMDKDGNVMVAQVMRDRLYDLQNGNKEKGVKALGYEEGFQAWLDEYGDAAYMLSQPKSNSLVYGAPVTEDGVAWERANPEARRKYPNTYGFFAPTTGEFNYEAYARQFRSGQREGISVEQATMLANNRVGAHLYAQAKAKMPEKPTDEDRAWLRDIKAGIKEQYYGFAMDVPGISKKTDRDTAIAEVQRAVTDPVIASTDAGQGAALYLRARQKVVEAGRTPTSFRAGKAHIEDRAWLRDIADGVIAEYPGFEQVWELLFSAELADDDVEETDG